MRKAAFCICENKVAADQCHCFPYIDSSVLLLPKFRTIFCGCMARFVSDLVGNTKDRFSCVDLC